MAMHECYFCSTQIKATVNNCPQCGQPQMMQGKYRLVSLLGQGGFGIVYEAVDTRLNRRYAVKMITASNAAHQKQVEAEANILAQHARHFSFMPEVYDTWSEGSRTVLVMEYIEGPTLGEVLASQGSWAPAEVEAFLRTMLGQLDQLHAAGIIHRDLKPDNIKRTPQGRFVLLDFGIAKQSGGTLTGAKALSLYYSPPEQARGQSTDARSDLYSLAATAYHLLTGSPPSPSEYRASMGIPLVPPGEKAPGVPETLEQALITMLEISPDDRPADAPSALKLLDQPAAHLRVARTAAAAQVAAAMEPQLAKATIVLPKGQEPADGASGPRGKGRRRGKGREGGEDGAHGQLHPRRRFGPRWLFGTLGIMVAISAAFGLGAFNDEEAIIDSRTDGRGTPTLVADSTAMPTVAAAALPPPRGDVPPPDVAGGMPPAPDAPQLTERGPSVKIVSAMPMVGPFQDTLNGYQMAIASIPICGSIQVDLVPLDTVDGGNPWGRAATNAKGAVADGKTLLVLTTGDSPALQEMIPILNEADIGLVSSEAADPMLTKPALGLVPADLYPSGQRNFVRVIPTAELQGTRGAQWADQRGAKRVFVIDDSGSPVHHLIKEAFMQQADAEALEIVGGFTLEPGTLISREQLAEISAAAPDLVFFSGADPISAGLIAQELRHGPLAAEEPDLMLTDSVQSGEFLKAAGPAAEGALFTSLILPPPELGGPADEWLRAYQERYGMPASHHAVLGFEAMSLALNAIDNTCENLSPAAVREQLLFHKTYPSLLGSEGIDDNGDTLFADLAGLEVEDGAIVFSRRLDQ
ncbi:MAG TPA: bifunctional serine/threonine-protein kinase/ABC transporter substrate-binding protein [Herpetosiphonaceae bacterium]